MIGKRSLLPVALLLLGAVGASCKKDPPETLTGAVHLTQKIAEEVFDENSGYSEVTGLFDPRIGLIATGKFSGSVNPMKKDETWNKDFEKDLEFVRRAAASGILAPNLKVVVAFRNPVGEYVRIWYGSRVAEIKDFKAEAKKLAKGPTKAEEGRQMFFYNGIANGPGGYPDWNAVFEWKELLMSNLAGEGYQAQGFILPTFGPVFIVKKDSIEKARMRKLHADFYHGLHGASRLYPRVLLHTREKSRYITIIHDVSSDNPHDFSSTVFPATE